MKALIFTDIHASISSFKKLQQKIETNKPEIIFCTGDFTVMEQNVEEVMHKINDLGLPTFLIHGNHETELIVKKLSTRYKNIIFMHKRIMPYKDYYILGHGGGGFSRTDKDFEQYIRKNKDQLKNKKVILMTHAPPYQTKLDYIDWLDENVGCKSYTDFIETFQPILALSGHIHECFGNTQLIGKTKLINPGPDGKIITL